MSNKVLDFLPVYHYTVHMAIVYSITNQKGGVGKTTTCLCLGSALAEMSYRVLLIDLDPQAGLTVSLGYDSDSFEKTIYDSLINCERYPLQQIIKETKIENLFPLISDHI